MGKTKQAIRALGAAIKADVMSVLSLYYVQVRGATTARHYCWTWQQALQWAACYGVGGKTGGEDAVRIYRHGVRGKPVLVALR